MKKLLSLILLLCAFSLCFSGCRKTKDTDVIPKEDIHTEYEGVYLTCESINTYTCKCQKPHRYNAINVVWHNETEKEVIYGEAYAIEYKNGEEWEDITPKDLYFNEIANLLEPNSTTSKTYSTEHLHLSKEGHYRLVCKFSTAGGSGYKTWVEFDVEYQNS